MNSIDIWAAIDTLAALHKVSLSKLAQMGGLDATSFNPSKRITRGGNLRWPTFGTVAQVLRATGTSWREFVCLIPHNNERPHPNDPD